MSLLGFWDLRVPSSVLAIGKAKDFSKIVDQDMESRGGVKTGVPKYGLVAGVPRTSLASSTVIDMGSIDSDRPLVRWKGSLLLKL